MLMMLPPAAPKLLDRVLRREHQAENIHVELPVEMFLGDLFEREKFINARVVHENVEPAKGFLRLGEQTFNVRFLRNVRLHCDSFSARAGNFTDDLVRSRFAGSVIDDDGCAFGGQMSGDGRADAFGGAR